MVLSDLDKNHAFPRLFPMVDNEVGCAICGLMWIETREGVQVDEKGDIQVTL